LKYSSNLDHFFFIIRLNQLIKFYHGLPIPNLSPYLSHFSIYLPRKRIYNPKKKVAFTMGRVNPFPPWEKWLLHHWFNNKIIEWLRCITCYPLETFCFCKITKMWTPHVNRILFICLGRFFLLNGHCVYELYLNLKISPL